jgi:DcuC family C4-dicarboxylate transporter
MLGVLLAGVVTGWIVYMIAKKAYPVAVLLLAGIALMACGSAFHLGTVLGPKATTGSLVLDVFDAVRQLFATRVAELGLSIMSMAGFSRYMDQVNASQALFDLVGAPLRRIRSTTLLLGLAFLVAQLLTPFVPSHAGHNLLLMVTMYPILIRLGVSRLSALGTIGLSHFLDMGPGSGNIMYAAKALNMEASVFYIKYQLPATIPLILAVTVFNCFVQRWWDKREGPDLEGAAALEALQVQDKPTPPRIYAFLPMLPLVLLLGFCPLITEPFGFSIKMEPFTAMLISTLVSMLFEYVRLRSATTALGTLKAFYEGMGKQFVMVVSLIVAGEIYAKGLVTVGAVTTVINAAQSAGLGAGAMIIVGGAIIMVAAFLMGSGNAAFFSFGSLVPKIAEHLGVPGITLILPLMTASGLGRTASPVTGALVAIAGIAGVSSFQVAKRTCIPVIFAFIVGNVIFLWYFNLL